MKNNIFAVVNWKKFAQVAIASAIMFTSTAAMVANPYSADGTIFSVQPITASAEITVNGIANAAKSCGSKAIDKGLDWVFDKLPLPPGIDDLTDYFKGELGGMIKGFLGLEGKEAFEKLYSNNYLTGSDLNELLHTVESAGISVADYLAKNNNPLPEGAKYLLVGETKTDHTVDDHTVYCTDYYTDHVTVIDVNDPTQKHIDLVVSTYNHHVRYGIGAKHFDSKHDQTPVELVSIQQVVTNTKTPFGEMTNDQYHLSSGIYKLGKDVYLNGSISVDNGRTVVIDLNGHKIDRNLQKVGNVGSVINVWKGGNLRLIDSSENGGGIFAGEHVEIKDGRIESNKSEAAYGGGLHIDGNLVTTHMEIRNISFIGNVSKCGEGGAISSGRSLSALNSLFADNRTDGNGGALYLGNVSNFDYRLKKSDITVSGGNIFDNSAKRGTVLYYAADMNFSFTDGAKYSGSIY